MAGLIIFVIIGGAVGFASYTQAQAQRRTWGRAAAELGFTMQPNQGMFSTPALTGMVDTMRVDVSVQRRRNDNSQSFTRYLIRHPTVGPPLTLTKQSPLSFLGRLVGQRDVLIGDPFFDERVIIDSREVDSVRAFLTPVRRAAVMELFAAHPKGAFTQDSVRIETRGVAKTPTEIVRTVRWLLNIASVMGDNRLDEILEHQQHGDLVRAAEELHEFNRTQGNAFTQMLEAEAFTEAGRHDDAAPVFDTLERQLPADTGLHGWQRVSHLPPPPAVPDPSTLSIAPPVDVRQAVVIDDLFSAERMSWEIVEHFEQTYRNQVVEWTGTMTRFEPYTADRDFGEGPGTKATIMIGHSGESVLISNEVHAIVDLGADTTMRIDAQVRFRGVLTNVDRFSRKIWVQQATLLA